MAAGVVCGAVSLRPKTPSRRIAVATPKQPHATVRFVSCTPWPPPRLLPPGLPSMLRTEVVLCLFNGVVSRVPWLEPRPPQFLVDLLLRLQVGRRARSV